MAATLQAEGFGPIKTLLQCQELLSECLQVSIQLLNAMKMNEHDPCDPHITAIAKAQRVTDSCQSQGRKDAGKNPSSSTGQGEAACPCGVVQKLAALSCP